MLRDKRYILPVILFAFVALGAYVASIAFAHTATDNNGALDYDLDLPRVVSPESARYIGLKTAEVRRDAIKDVVEATGVVRAQPDRTFIGATRFSGTLRAITRNVGDPVAAGEVVARIDSADLARNEVELRRLEIERQKTLLDAERSTEDNIQVEQNLTYLKTQIESALKDYNRMLEQKNSGAAVSETDLAAKAALVARNKILIKTKTRQLEINQKLVELSQKEAETVQSLITALQSANAAGGQDPGVLELKAPFAGVLVSRTGAPGQWVQPGQTLFEVADFTTVQVVAELPESMAARLRERKSARVTVALPNSSWRSEGKVRSVSSTLDPRKRTLQVLVDVPNPDGMLLGEMAVDIGLELSERKQALVVPVAALLSEGPIRYVFVESGGAYQKQDVVPGARDDQNVEIKEGLAPGDVVVVGGAPALALMPGKRRN